MYADDLILLAPSISELQAMVDICSDEIESLDLKLNVSKRVSELVSNDTQLQLQSRQIMM